MFPSIELIYVSGLAADRHPNADPADPSRLLVFGSLIILEAHTLVPPVYIVDLGCGKSWKDDERCALKKGMKVVVENVIPKPVINLLPNTIFI